MGVLQSVNDNMQTSVAGRRQIAECRPGMQNGIDPDADMLLSLEESVARGPHRLSTYDED